MPTDTPLVEMRDMRVAFGGVHAVDGVSVDLFAGEVVALVGGNGAGKTTLIRTLSGAHKADAGQILINGEPVTISTPRDAKDLGIETIYQTLALADNTNAPANVFLGRELTTRWGNLDTSAMESETRKLMSRLNPKFKNFVSPVSNLSGGQRQSIAIARAIHWQARLVIMDEPTAALGVPEQREVMALIRRLKERDVGIILISHNLPDIFAAADRIVVLARGSVAGERRPSETNDEEIVRMMMGATL